MFAVVIQKVISFILEMEMCSCCFKEEKKSADEQFFIIYYYIKLKKKQENLCIWSAGHVNQDMLGISNWYMGEND